MVTGIVKWFNAEKGYGFIMPYEGRKDFLAHYSEIRSYGYKSIQENQRVTFYIGEFPKGPSAKNYYCRRVSFSWQLENLRMGANSIVDFYFISPFVEMLRGLLLLI